MDYRKSALVLNVIKCLRKQGSWTGKTHVQKSLFLLKATSGMEVPFTYVLYKHGPYSFEVESELEQMRSYAAITSEPDPDGYGVVLKPGPGANFIERGARWEEAEAQEVEKICRFVGRRNVSELERLATAAWIRTNEGVRETRGVASRLHELKPHVPVSEAELADAELLLLIDNPEHRAHLGGDANYGR
jgi:hypothetical protein